MTTHTPGPWIAHDGFICSLADPNHVVIGMCAKEVLSDEESAANASMMAAAPAMLVALCEVKATFDSMCIEAGWRKLPGGLCEQVDAAIAAAKGGKK